MHSWLYVGSGSCRSIRATLHRLLRRINEQRLQLKTSQFAADSLVAKIIIGVNLSLKIAHLDVSVKRFNHCLLIIVVIARWKHLCLSGLSTLEGSLLEIWNRQLRLN